MSNLTINYIFDAQQHEPDTGLTPVPAGQYDLKITGASIEDTRTENCRCFKVEFTILSGDFAGRKLFNRYNLWHTSPQTVEIAHKQLSGLCHVIGVYKVDFNNGGGALINGALKADVTNDGTYNAIKSVYDMAGNKPSRAGSPAQIAQPVSTVPSGYAAVQMAPVGYQQPVAVVSPAQQATNPVAQPQPAQTPWGAPPVAVQPQPAQTQPQPQQAVVAPWAQQPQAQ